MRRCRWRGLSRWLLLVAAVMPLGLAGCSGASVGTVTGKVYTKDGKVVKGGYVTFLTADKQVSRLSSIGEDGSYTIDQIPAGDVKIGVETESVRQAASRPSNRPPKDAPAGAGNTNQPANPADLAKRYVKINPKYADADQSGLTYTVKGGKQEHDIKLD